MGTRIVYQVRDSNEDLVATLFSNCSHTTQNAEAIFHEALHSVHCSSGPNTLVEHLLQVRYTTTEGNHHVGDRIFWLVPACEVTRDCETVVLATHTRQRGASPGRTPDHAGGWNTLRFASDDPAMLDAATHQLTGFPQFAGIPMEYTRRGT